MPKRTKAKKKGDIKQKKAWLRKSQKTNYRDAFKTQNETILIVCEGQTEQLYFQKFPVVSLTVEVIDLGGQSKCKLVESTVEIIQNSDTEYDKIWCVFDMDKNQGEKEFADFDNAIQKADNLNYEVAYSNDVFELWFYLHYEFTDAQNHRQFYYEFLSKKWNMNYVRDGKKYQFCNKLYELLQNDENASQKLAIDRAEKLFEAQKGLKFHQQNPVTKVHELVKTLNENLRG